MPQSSCCLSAYTQATTAAEQWCHRQQLELLEEQLRVVLAYQQHLQGDSTEEGPVSFCARQPQSSMTSGSSAVTA